MRRCFSNFSSKMISEAVVNLDGDLSEDDVQRMLDHINQLDQIRMDPNFRTVFLFQEDSYHDFIKEFNERQPRMSDFLKELEADAVQLDSMNKGAKISSVVGSSVGAVGGVLSIVGLALIPVTAGVSLALTMTGIGMGVTSGVNSIVTTATEIGVNRTHQKNASKVLQSFMEDVMKLQDCLEQVMQQAVAKMETSGLGVVHEVFKIAYECTGFIYTGRFTSGDVETAVGKSVLTSFEDFLEMHRTTQPKSFDTFNQQFVKLVKEKEKELELKMVDEFISEELSAINKEKELELKMVDEFISEELGKLSKLTPGHTGNYL
ncbi:uncharacterized protein V3H82_024496 [Fundulus diaphanus]